MYVYNVRPVSVEIHGDPDHPIELRQLVKRKIPAAAFNFLRNPGIANEVGKVAEGNVGKLVQGDVGKVVQGNVGKALTNTVQQVGKDAAQLTSNNVLQQVDKKVEQTVGTAGAVAVKGLSET